VTCLRYCATLVRVSIIAVLILTCSGISSLVNAATHNPGDQCSDCGSDGPDGSDPRSCPPGPLCPCAPHIIVASEQARVVPIESIAIVPLTVFTVDTRIPASVVSDGVFHPPRLIS
jgi:hypothetical protein